MKARYDNLNGLKTIAVIGIVMMHVLSNVPVQPQGNYLINVVIPYFTNFTFLFMMVSAFGMSCGYYELVKSGQMIPNDFYSKRYIRIWPFFAMLVFLDVVISHDISSFYEAFANLTLCFSLLPVPKIDVIGVGWFLGLVFLFYMLFPFFVFLMDNKKRAWFSFLVSLVFSWMLVNYFSRDELLVEPADRRNIIYSAPFFMIGGLIYLYRDVLQKNVERYNIISFVACVAITVLKFSISTDELYVIPDLFMFAAWLVFAIGSKNRLLDNKVVEYISSISMEVYLSHMVVFRAVSFLPIYKWSMYVNFNYFVVLLFTLGGTIIFSHIVKFWIFPRIKWLN